MRFKYNKEADGSIHLTKKHGISTRLVEAHFHMVTKDYQDGNTRIRLCKVPPKSILKVVYRWIVINQEVFIITAYYF